MSEHFFFFDGISGQLYTNSSSFQEPNQLNGESANC